MDDRSSDSALPPDRLLAQSGWVRALARTLVADPHAAEDLVQDAFVKALESPPRETSEPVLRAWLGKVVRNFAALRARGEANRRARDERAARSEAAAADPVVMLAEPLQGVVEAVMALDEPYRSTVLLHYYEGLASEDIAQRAKTAPATVRKRLSRAHERLRERLDSRYGERGAWSLVLSGWLEGRDPGVAASAGAATPTPTAGVWIMSLEAKWIAAITLFVLSSVVVFRGGEEAPLRETTVAEAGRLEPKVAPVELEGRSSQRSAVAPVVASTSSAGETDEEAGFRLRGRVRLSSGAGVAFAEVSVRERGKPQTFVVTRADAQGRYSLSYANLPLISPRTPESERGVTLDVRASAPGHFESSLACEVDALRTTPKEGVDLVLEKGATWSGRVFDEEGRPVAATIEIYTAEGRWLQRAGSASDGRYRTARPAGDAFRLVAHSNEFGVGMLGPIQPAGGQEERLPDLELTSMGVIEGVVRRPNGEPVAQRAVYAFPGEEALREIPKGPRYGAGRWRDPNGEEDAGLWRRGGLSWGAAITDEQGFFTIRGLRPNYFSLVTGSPRDGQQHGEFAAGSVCELVEEGWTVRIRTLDTDGLPVPGGVLNVEGNSEDEEASFWGAGTGIEPTEAEVFPGEWVATVACQGMKPTTETFHVGEEDYLVEVDLVLDFDAHGVHEGVVVLKVVDAKGKPVWTEADFQLLADPGGEEVSGMYYEGEIPKEGKRFELPEGHYSLRAWPKDPARSYVLDARGEFEVVAGETKAATIRASTGGRLRLDLVLPVGAVRPDHKQTRIDLTSFGDGSKHQLYRFIVPNDEGGWYQRHGYYFDGPVPSEPLPSGAYNVRIHVPGFAPVEHEVTLRSGETTDLVYRF